MCVCGLLIETLLLEVESLWVSGEQWLLPPTVLFVTGQNASFEKICYKVSYKSLKGREEKKHTHSKILQFVKTSSQLDFLLYGCIIMSALMNDKGGSLPEILRRQMRLSILMSLSGLGKDRSGLGAALDVCSASSFLNKHVSGKSQPTSIRRCISCLYLFFFNYDLLCN